MNAECTGCRDRFSEYIDGELSAPKQRAVESHLSACAECRAELEAWRRTVRAVSELPTRPAPAEFGARVMKRLRAHEAAPQPVVVRLLWSRLLPIAAMVLAVALLTLTVSRHASIGGPTATARLAMSRVGPAVPTKAAPAEAPASVAYGAGMAAAARAKGAPAAAPLGPAPVEMARREVGQALQEGLANAAPLVAAAPLARVPEPRKTEEAAVADALKAAEERGAGERTNAEPGHVVMATKPSAVPGPAAQPFAPPKATAETAGPALSWGAPGEEAEVRVEGAKEARGAEAPAMTGAPMGPPSGALAATGRMRAAFAPPAAAPVAQVAAARARVAGTGRPGEQLFVQVARGDAANAAQPVQQVLTIVGRDQATLARQVVAVANDNGIETGLELRDDKSGGTVDVYLSVPAAQYDALLKALVTLTPPAQQRLENTPAAQGDFYRTALANYGLYQNAGLDTGRAREETRKDFAAAGPAMERLGQAPAGLAKSPASMRAVVPEAGVAAGARAFGGASGAAAPEEPVNLMVRIVPPAAAEER